MTTSKTAKRLRWALLLIGAAAVLLVVYTGHQALKAKEALDNVAADFHTLTGQLTSGDEAGARATLQQAQQHAEQARKETHGPGWWLTSKIPGVGPNVTAVRTVAGVSDSLSSDVLPRVVSASQTLDPQKLRPRHGRVALRPIIKVAPAVVTADRRLRQQAGKVDAIDSGELAPQIGKPVRELQGKLAIATALSDRASRAVRLLPDMLGAHGRRTYLLMFQNNAELRSTGGIPGAFATITANHGKVSLEQQGNAGTIGKLSKPAIPLTRQERALFGSYLGIYPQDANVTPDFPRTAELEKAMWQAKGGGHVDGVISTDPVALSNVLHGTGPIRLAGGQQLSADNAVTQLLNQAYFQISNPDQQNAYFASVAKRAFDAFSSGQGQPQAVLNGVVDAVDARRILVWSDRPQEQAILQPTALSGALPRKPGSGPNVGVYLNDNTAAKMDYYLHYAVSARSTSCQGGHQHLTVTMTIKNTAPKDVASLPDYVTGSTPGIPRGTARTSVYAFAPIAGSTSRATLDGAKQPLNRFQLDGRRLVAQTIDVAPGQSRRLSYDMVSGPGQTGPLKLRVTPGAHGSGIGHIGPNACS